MIGGPSLARVYSLTLHNDQLVRGGYPFGSSEPPVLMWDGAAWQPLAPRSHTVNSLIDFNQTLFAASADTNGFVYFWDGATWSALPGSGPTQTLSVWRGQLMAGGMLWDGASRQPLSAGLTSQIFNATSIWHDTLVAGGSFTRVSGVDAQYVARYDGATWQPLGSGMTRDVNAMAEFDSKLIVGSRYTSNSTELGSELVAWDGSSWQPYAPGLSQPYGGSGSLVQALAVYNGELVAAGYYGMAGGTPVSNIAAWNGQGWHALGTLGVGTGPAYSLCVYHNELIAAGSLTFADGQPVRNIAAWNGTAWHALGTDPNSGTDGTIYAAVPVGDRLIVGGEFSTAGAAAARNVAAWNGDSWNAMGSGVGGASDYNRVRAICEFGGQLYIGGHFVQAGSQPAANLALWFAANWVSVNGFLDNEVRALLPMSDLLFVGGSFTEVAGTSNSGVAGLDSNGWHFLGTGLNQGPVNALASYNGQLFAGGGFLTSGSIVNARVARWACPCYANCDGSVEPPILNINDFQCFLNRFAAADPWANCDGSTTPPILTAADFQCFLNAYASGCP